MKLYTEEEVRNAIQIADKYHYLLDSEENEIVKSLTPIELPSDEEIEEESPYVPSDASLDFWAHKEGFIDGAKCMRNKIQGETYLKCTCSNSLQYSNCSKKCERIIDEQGDNNEQ